MLDRTRVIVGVLVFALVAYLVLVASRGIYLLGRPELALKVFGVAVLVFPVIGVWVIWQEVQFGRATQRLTDQLVDPAALPVDDELAAEEALPRRPSGRVDRVAADALFAARRARVEAAPQDWRAWYRLAVAYDLAGDRRRARSAMRTAISYNHPGD